VEKKRIKSAWEIALERAEKLGELSPEEIRAAEEAKYTPIGQALAARYLAGLSIRDFQLFLDKYDGQARTMVEKSAALALVDALDLKEPTSALRATQGLQALAPELGLADKARAAYELIGDYLRIVEEGMVSKSESMRTKAERRLQDLGISGSAVRVNIARSPEWREFVEGEQSDFSSRLAPLKMELQSILLAKPFWWFTTENLKQRHSD